MMMPETGDYSNRTYLSAIEAAKYLEVSVEKIHALARNGALSPGISASGQMRFRIDDLEKYENGKKSWTAKREPKRSRNTSRNAYIVRRNHTVQRIFVANSMKMGDLEDDSVHLMLTSPPYFDTKMYSRVPIENDLGNIHDADLWFDEIGNVWKEVYRVLQPGRKAFINIMNLPVRLDGGGFRTLNLAGRTIDLCEDVGFVFKRDIVWHKTNAVRAHFGTYPYPGGILLNNMHEFILEFDKPAKKGHRKYAHVTKRQKEQSRLDKDFWVSIKKSDVWLMKPEGSGGRRSHIAPFPYELPYRLIKAFSYVGETVLDPFAGSGTALKAAIGLKRNGVGYELNPEIAYDAVKALKSA